jgi:mRNA-degrading endonuclease RelE of RelBE toxin-antitoxin system
LASLWSVQILPDARRALRALDEDVRLEAVQAIAELTEDPFPFDCVQMEGYADLYRVRFYGERYRVVYRVIERSRKVLITRVGPRGSVYGGLLKPGRKG